MASSLVSITAILHPGGESIKSCSVSFVSQMPGCTEFSCFKTFHMPDIDLNTTNELLTYSNEEENNSVLVDCSNSNSCARQHGWNAG